MPRSQAQHSFWYRFFVVMLSCYLTYHWNVMPVAQAQESKGDISVTCEGEGNARKCTAGTHKFDDQAGFLGSQIYNIIITWAASAVLIFIVGQCLDRANSCSWAALTAAAGALAMLAAEVVGMAKNAAWTSDTVRYRMDLLKKYKAQCEAGTPPPTSETKGINVCDSFDSLKAQKEAYIQIKEGLEIKFALYLGAIGALGISAILEYMKAAEYVAYLTNLQTLMTTARTSCQSAVDNQQSGIDCTAARTSCAPGIGQLQSGAILQIQTDYFQPFSAMDSTTRRQQFQTRMTEARTTFMTSCNQAALATCAQCQGQIPAITTQMDKLLQDFNCRGNNCNLGGNVSRPSFSAGVDKNWDYFKNIFKIIPKAIADDKRQGSSSVNVFQWLMSGVGLAAVIAFFIVMMTAWDKIIDKFWGIPLARGITYTVLAALVGGLVGLIKGYQIPVLEKNIKAIDDILARGGLNEIKMNETKLKTVPFGDVQLPANLFEEEQPVTDQNGNKAPCALGGDGKGGCLHPSENPQIRLSNQGLSALTAGVNAAQNMEKGICGRDTVSTAAFRGAQELAGMGSAIKKKLRETEDLLNKKLKDAKMAPINFEEARAKMQRQMYNTAKPLLESKDGKAFVAAVAKGIPEGQISDDAKKALSQDAKNALGTTAAGALGGADQSSFEMTSLEETPVVMEAGLESAPVDVTGKTVKDEGIFNNPDAIIFEQISVRYLKSAYPVLFDEQQQ